MGFADGTDANCAAGAISRADIKSATEQDSDLAPLQQAYGTSEMSSLVPVDGWSNVSDGRELTGRQGNVGRTGHGTGDGALPRKESSFTHAGTRAPTFRGHLCINEIFSLDSLIDDTLVDVHWPPVMQMILYHLTFVGITKIRCPVPEW